MLNQYTAYITLGFASIWALKSMPDQMQFAIGDYPPIFRGSFGKLFMVLTRFILGLYGYYLFLGFSIIFMQGLWHWKLGASFIGLVTGYCVWKAIKSIPIVGILSRTFFGSIISWGLVALSILLLSKDIL